VTYSPVVVEQFPGLDLRADPGDSRGALDAQNVSIDPDAVRVRGGLQTFYTAATKPVFLDRFQRSSGAVQMIMAQKSATNTYQAIRSDGTVLASSSLTGASDYGASGVALGTSAAEYFFLAYGGATFRRWDGSAWSTPAGTFPTSVKVFSILPTDQRLVAITDADVVWFSDPGAPETYTSTSFLRLTPGDGERINGAATYNNQTFIFKYTKFYVFYGTSDNPSAPGTPLFNYRTVNTGIGMYYTSPQSVCTARDGVYFIGQDGVYRTTGGPPEKVSRPLDPFWSRNPSAFWLGGSWAETTNNSNIPGRIVALGNMLYVSVPVSSSANVVFVLNLDTRVWSMWNINASAIVPFPYGLAAAVTTTTDVIYFADAANFKIGRYDLTATSDHSGTAIVSRYRTPFNTFGDPHEKKVREVIVEGVGSPTVQVSHDWGALATGGAVTLGTSPATAVGRRRDAMRGRAFSLQFGASSGLWAVNRAQVNVSPVARSVSFAR
jgi:hypothetical protein